MSMAQVVPLMEAEFRRDCAEGLRHRRRPSRRVEGSMPRNGGPLAEVVFFNTLFPNVDAGNFQLPEPQDYTV